jgi:hypothetical protein
VGRAPTHNEHSRDKPVIFLPLPGLLTCTSTAVGEWQCGGSIHWLLVQCKGSQ